MLVKEKTMMRLRTPAALATLLLALTPLRLDAIQLEPVVTTGLASPLFVGHAGDGSNRLFIVEQGGVVRVLQPEASIPTVFLDIQTKVAVDFEQGLLGLAFHPQYASNGRFFVFYTRAGDGTLVIAEYRVSADPNVADPMETVILTIPHPTFTNHNGGMLAFGSDGYLYIGVGDGGSGDDPPNNAQNVDVLLGKILRIDIDAPGVLYASPPTNPFFGATPGRDEIFAYGLRNPWRFSFDRVTHQQWVADVGQAAREEVDTPIVGGGNYGWRVFEGSSCTNLDPALCDSPQNYIFPLFEYDHSTGRCSITGGYVYRGSQGALPVGTYVYGDFCTGEILGWNGSSQSLLLHESINITSFGEDEVGELYVVGRGGTVHRIVACTYSVSPTRIEFGSEGGTGSVIVTAGTACPWTAQSNASWITITGGASGSGDGTVTYSVAPYTGRPRKRTGTMTIAGQTVTVRQSR
jgi:glucose/arabinose dehydrogenase